MRLAVVAGIAALSLVFAGNALALDHVVIKTHDVKLAQATTKKLPPYCRKGQKSTKKHPCRKRANGLSEALGPPDAGWNFGLSISQQTDGGWQLFVALRRAVGAVIEQHGYSFKLAPTAVTVGPDLSTATLDTGTQLGQFGSMKLTFMNPGPLAAGTPALACTTGNWQMRTGTMAGQVSFVADNHYFHTIVETSLPTDVSANTGDPPTCGTYVPPCGHASSMSVLGSSSGPYLYASLQNGAVQFLEFLTEPIGPATVSHSVSESGLPAGDLTLASDLSTGGILTTGSTRFTGNLSFTAGGPAQTSPYPSCGAGATFSLARGTTTGGVVAHFLAIPAPGAISGQAFLSVQ